MGDTFAGVTAAILAGGLGTRLRSVVTDQPKCLAPVGGRPFLDYLLDQLADAGLREVVLLTGHLAGKVREAVGDGRAGMRTRHSVEPSPLGTGGAVRHALPLLNAPTVLLVNGDTYCDVDLRSFAHFHRGRAARISMVLTRVADTSRFGQAETTADGRVVRFEEKADTHGAGWINAGVSLLERGLIEEIPAGPCSLERERVPGWTRAGWVYGYRCEGRFIDIGTPQSYAQAEAFFRMEQPLT
jgi:D-glycero-alpha-D-manno-heptose 1-phosphate guanylyltransferase